MEQNMQNNIDFYLCENCLTIPTIKILEDDTIKIFCNKCCQVDKIITMDEYLEAIGIGSETINLTYQCENRFCSNDIIYFCGQCCQHLCDICKEAFHNDHMNVVKINSIITDEEIEEESKYLNSISDDILNNITDDDEYQNNMKKILFYQSLLSCYYKSNAVDNYNIRLNIKLNSPNDLFKIGNNDINNNIIINNEEYEIKNKNTSYIYCIFDIKDAEKYKEDWEKEGRLRIIGESCTSINENNCILYMDHVEIPFTKTIQLRGKHKLKIEFKKGIIIKTLKDLFNNCTSLAFVSFINFDSSSLENIDNLFYNCNAISNINLTNFKTNNIISMKNTFYNCSNLKNLNLSNFNTKNCVSMEGLFNGCSSLYDLDLKSFNTSNVCNMSYMFSYCCFLTQINLSNFITNNVADMKGMFYHCCSLTTLDLKNFNTSKVIDMSNMFQSCYDLTYINLSSFRTHNVQNMKEMFESCTSLAYIDLKNFCTSEVYCMKHMFKDCFKLVDVNLEKFMTMKLIQSDNLFNDPENSY